MVKGCYNTIFMNFNLISLKTLQLSKNKVTEICRLKDSQWKFGIKSQHQWFKDNVKKNDIHNLLYIKSKLIGYTLLRIRLYNTDNNFKKKNYILFDTLVLNKNYRKKKLSDLMMTYNNMIIKETGFFSFLICKNDLVSFYKKYNWIKLNKKNINVVDHSFSTNGMLFNTKNIQKYYFFFDK